MLLGAAALAVPWEIEMKGFWRTLAAMLLALVAMAASAQPQIGTIGVFSLLGDGVQVTSNDDQPRDSRIERMSRETLNFRNVGFDLIALRVAREALVRQYPAARVSMYRSPDAISVEDQRSLARSAAKAELPGWMVKTIEQARLTHLLIITGSRGSLDARTGDGVTIGRGAVDGIGFYIDTLYTIRNSSTGALSTGLLAPHVQIKVQLMDAASGEMVGEYDVRDAYTYGSPEVQVRADPWTFMPFEEKIRVLREMVEKGISRAMTELLKSR